MTHTRLIILTASSAVLTSCSNPADATGCRAVEKPAIVVEIVDARTGAAIAADARGVVRDGAYVDSLRPHASLGDWPEGMYSLQAANERTGVYAVEVRHDGYQPWSAMGIRVTRDECHVRTATIRAALVPDA